MITTKERSKTIVTLPRLTLNVIDFELPPELEASEPPEARGLTRDSVRLMVSYTANDHIEHATFRDIGDYVQAGDVLVLNTSGTLKAALHARRAANGQAMDLHLSTQLPAGLWIVEVRTLTGKVSQPFFNAQAGEVYYLPDGGRVTLLAAHQPEQRGKSGPVRLWIATLDLPDDLHTYLDAHGFPIRYGYVPDSWPIDAYQTVYATEAGSAEMPSAGRAFTPELLTHLMTRGVQIVPLILHTGVASPEDHEPPYEEYYRVPATTAQAVNTARSQGRRVIAIGTTVVRALETVTSAEGITHAGEGWTELVITAERGMHAVNGMLTGFHEPRASHLAMLEALAGRHHLDVSYQTALDARYLWHEFGDLHLILS